MTRSTPAGANHHALCAVAVPLLRARGAKIVLAEPRLQTSGRGECPDAIGWPSPSGFRRHAGSMLIEAKATRSDFLADRRKPYHDRPEDYPGERRWYLVPDQSVARPEDLPPGWGLIVFGGSGRRSVEVVAPTLFTLSGRGVGVERSLLLAAVHRHQLGARWLGDEARFLPMDDSGRGGAEARHRERLAARRAGTPSQPRLL